MDLLIKIIGVVFVGMCILYLLKPEILRSILAFFKFGNRLYIAGVIRLIFAVVFLLAARECKVQWLIFAFGILFLLSAIMVFVLGPKKLVGMLNWYQKQPALVLRITAVTGMILGAIILYAA